MNNYLYAMNKSFEDMMGTIRETLDKMEYTESEKQELFFAIGTYIHAALDYAARVEIDKEYTKVISAFRYINNGLKHSIMIKEISHDVGGISFSDFQFPLEIPERKVI